MNAIEPERMILVRTLPYIGPAGLTAFLLGWAIGGLDAGSSAAIGVAVVAANLAASALATSWAARISPTMLYGVAVGGFLVRMLVLVLVLVLLDPTSWFSPLAFALTVVPTTIALLAFEARSLAGRTQADLWYFRETTV
jgi:ATP synthase protein I